MRIQIEGYPIHETCGGALRPTRTAGQLRCMRCDVVVLATRDEEDLARGAERRAQQAAIKGETVERLPGQLLPKPAAQCSLFEAKLLEGGPIQTGRRAG